MNLRPVTPLLLGTLAVGTLLAGCAAPTQTAVAPRGTVSPGIPKSLEWQPNAADGWLNAISVPSATAGWAVGSAACGSPCSGGGMAGTGAMILRWDGSAWSLAASSGPADQGVLTGVTAGPSGTAWAVGDICSANCGTPSQTRQALLLHWDGTSWAQTPSPPGGNARLYAVTAGADGTAWTVGYECTAGCGTAAEADAALILHWNGSAWSKVAVSGLRDAYLLGTSEGPGGTAWAVGYQCAASCGTLIEADKPLVLHWDGRAWARAQIPDAGQAAMLTGIAQASGGAWAVGVSCATSCDSGAHVARTLIMRWDGHAWSVAPSPSPAESATLDGVSAAPDGTAWAVGHSCLDCGTATEQDQPLIVHWDGHAWAQTPAPSPARILALSNVTTAPGGRAWAVGQSCQAACGTEAQQLQTLILRWDGKAWQVTRP